MIFGMSIKQFLHIRDLRVWELRSNNSSLVNYNILSPLATCFAPSLKITACSVWCLHLTLCQRLPALYLSAKREHVPFPLHRSVHWFVQLLSCWGEQEDWRVWVMMAERLLSDGGAGRQLVFSPPSMVCQRHLLVPSVLSYKSGNFLPACSGEL